MTKLVFASISDSPSVELPETGVVIGRAPDCTLPIVEDSVSGHHAVISCGAGGSDFLKQTMFVVLRITKAADCSILECSSP